MSRITVTRTIAAPLDLVFQTVADERRLSQALPHIVRVTFVSDVKAGVGTRFRETRLMNGKKATTELEVTESSVCPEIYFALQKSPENQKKLLEE